jgi:putative transcriptional regulator
MKAMPVRHHLSDDLLLGYAQATLAEGWSLVVATHLALCPHCRGAVARFEQMGGSAVDELAPAPLADDALERTLARARAGAPEAAPAPRPPGGRAAILPQPLRDYAGADAEDMRWVPIGAGIRQRKLTSGPAVARLLFIPPGKAVPMHSHRGPECTLVLTGALIDRGETYVRGDVELTDETLTHQPTAGDGEPCIALAVTDAPLIFKTIGPKLLQKWIGI